MSVVSMGLSDEQLKVRCRSGDYAAFEQLYHRHKNPLYRFIYRQCADEELTKDIVQDVWLSIHRACGSYVPSAKFTTWLYRIAHNRVIDYYRRSRNGVPISYDDSFAEEQWLNMENSNEPEQIIQSAQETERLLSAIESLQEAQREVALLHLEMGFSVSEIANIMQSNPETTKSRLRYALKKIREQVSL
ncbi:MAG: sigma-70 family RNA polymerase sigma factor [Methyloprofundus sp.]|nr:sigma-70 family RNA polymerase sigma factor [Methyloprofundus sp.]